jgi:hypothetical protein
MSRSAEYKVWQGIIDRCQNPKNISFARYGGRGINVCHQWQESFAQFFADVGKRPGSDFELDRIDNHGDYEPENVQWLEKHEHMRKHGKGPKNEQAEVVDLVCAHWA